MSSWPHKATIKCANTHTYLEQLTVNTQEMLAFSFIHATFVNAS